MLLFNEITTVELLRLSSKWSEGRVGQEGQQAVGERCCRTQLSSWKVVAMLVGLILTQSSLYTGTILYIYF